MSRAGLAERVRVTVVEEVGQSQHLGTEQPVGRPGTCTQSRGSLPGLAVAPVRQQDGGPAPRGVVLVVVEGAGHQFLERGADAEQFLQVGEDRRVSVPYGPAAQGQFADAVVLVVLDPGVDEGFLGARATTQFRSGAHLV